MELDDATKAYVKGQSTWVIENSVGVGTKVRVTRIAHDGELGWSNCWVGEMNSAVGEVFTVNSHMKQDALDEQDKLDIYGIRLATIGNLSAYHDLMFPYYVLEVVR